MIIIEKVYFTNAQEIPANPIAGEDVTDEALQKGILPPYINGSYRVEFRLDYNMLTNDPFPGVRKTVVVSIRDTVTGAHRIIFGPEGNLIQVP